MNTAPELLRAAKLLQIALGHGVDLRPAAQEAAGRQDLLLDLHSPQRPNYKAIKKRPAWRIRLVLEHEGSPDAATRQDDTVLVLRRTTPDLRQEFREQGVNFIDLGGAVHVRLPWLILDRTDLPRQPLTKLGPSPVDPFGDRTSRVVRVLLETHLNARHDTRAVPPVWGVRELAATTGVDRTTTSKILRRLAAWQLVQLERQGRSVEARVSNPLRLIDRWSASYDWTANASVAVHAPIGDPNRFLARLPESLGTAIPHRRWALTLQAGASLLAPHASWERLHLYLDVVHPRELVEFAAHVRWPVGEDGNVVLMQPFYRTTIWDDLQHVRNLPVVSTLQLIIDLWQYPLRGREQAEHLLELWPNPNKKDLTRRKPAAH